MRTYDEMLTRVLLEWNAWRSTNIRVGDLRNVHWFRPAGAPHVLLHGYIPCAGLASGDIQHDCDTRSAPHWLRVCILKRHTLAAVYTYLAARADEQRTKLWESRPVMRALDIQGVDAQ